MKADVFRRLQRLFDEALAHPAETRIEWCQGRVDIDAALRDQLVRLLLRDQNLATASTRHPASLGTEALEHCADVIRLPQQRIPRYEVLEEIGRGGMGRVFRALRQDAVDKNEVAIKMVRRELMQEPVLKRFLVERRLLAALDHPGIARLLDAGEASDGTPFVAMELVRGLPLLRHCAQQSLDLRARLGLFRQVLAAVSHAHRNLIVHRDIKPANVLVTHDGCTKLLDFGIAKPLTAPAQDTATAERYLTPLYAAPELLSGAPANVTLDVYSLGALLYELLSGRPPFEFEGRSAAEVERLLLSTPPDPLDQAVASDPAVVAARLGVPDPWNWRRALRGDLNAIVQRALRKEAEQRYASVEQLDADIERYLRHEPVHASGLHAPYRLRKFVSRNRVAVATCVGATLAILVALMLALGQARIARQERDRAHAALAVLSDSFKAADPMQLSGGAFSARQVLDAASRRVDALDATQPRLHGELAAELADVRIALGMAESGDPALARALDWAVRDGSDAALIRRLRLLNARRLVATLALPEADRALTELEQSDPDAADVLAERAHYWLVQARPELAVPLAQRALQSLESQRGSLLHAEAAWQLAEAQHKAGRNEDARITLDSLLDLQQRSLGAQHPRSLITRLRRIDVLLALKEAELALRESSELIVALREHYGGESSVIALALATQASALAANRRHAEAADSFEAAGVAYAASLGAEHKNTFRVRFNAARLLQHIGADPARIDRLFEDAIAGASSAHGAGSPIATYFRIEYSGAKSARGDTNSARRILLPPDVDLDLSAMSTANRESLRRHLSTLFKPLPCAASAGAAPDSAIETRAQHRYCELAPAQPEPG